MSIETSELGDPPEQPEASVEALSSRRQPGDGGIVQNPPPVSLVPVPRASRIFLRHGAGHGEFANLTLTAPDGGPDDDSTSTPDS